MVRDLADHKVMPIHAGTAWYYFGGITLFLLGVQVITGVLLLLYYRPSVAEAFDSVRFIMTRVQFGWLIRQPFDPGGLRTHVQRGLHARFPAPARADLAQRNRAAGPDAGFRIQRVP